MTDEVERLARSIARLIRSSDALLLAGRTKELNRMERKIEEMMDRLERACGGQKGATEVLGKLLQRPKSLSRPVDTVKHGGNPEIDILLKKITELERLLRVPTMVNKATILNEIRQYKQTLRLVYGHST